jgi:putative ABC transport system substrate-binding protein
MWYRAVGCMVTFTLSLLATLPAADAQPPAKVPRIGVLSAWSLTTDARHRDTFLQGLHALGYVEGQTIVLEERWAEGQLQQLPNLAAELVRLQVDIIVAGNVPAARAASQATARIPIVVAGGDAVGTGLITNLARPGGNITGLATNAAELSGKWLELLKEAVPAISRVAVLSNPDTPITGPAVQELQVAAPTLGVQLQLLSVRDAGELEGAFAVMLREHAEALVVLPGSIFSLHSARISELAARDRLPTIWEWREAVAEGGLMAYGPDIASLWWRAATYVDKILIGAQPGELPVERPLTFKLVINLKTARALGIAISTTLLFQAAEVIPWIRGAHLTAARGGGAVSSDPLGVAGARLAGAAKGIVSGLRRVYTHPGPNHGMQPTASSVHSASASGRG